jgi:hypothetical protein
MHSHRFPERSQIAGERYQVASEVVTHCREVR